MACGKVLIVDDDVDSLAYLSHLVGEAGYRVDTLSEASKTVSRMVTAPPDMVFLDIQMPRMNGFQVLKSIRATDGLADIPVVFLSAISAVTGESYDPDKIEAQYGVRPDAFMSKTVEPTAVREQLAALMESRSP